MVRAWWPTQAADMRSGAMDGTNPACLLLLSERNKIPDRQRHLPQLMRPLERRRTRLGGFVPDDIAAIWISLPL